MAGDCSKYLMRRGQNAREQEEETTVTLLGGSPVRETVGLGLKDE